MEFPKWNPQRNTRQRLNSSDIKTRYKALRYSSSGFIAKKELREIIFKRDNYKCLTCGEENFLEIDHNNSVLSVIQGIYPTELLNTKQNLKTICKKCNAGKAP